MALVNCMHLFRHSLVPRLRILSCTLLLLCAAALSAQVAGSGTIQGTVTDPTGAVIPGAMVTLTETATQVKHTAS